MPFTTLRRRGSEDLSWSAVRGHRSRLASQPLPTTCYTLRCSASLRTDAFTAVDVVHAFDESLLSWLFPPFEDDLPVSPHTSAELLSWAFVIHPRLRLPLRFTSSPNGRALFRVSENRKNRPSSDPPGKPDLSTFEHSSVGFFAFGDRKSVV